MNGLKSFDKFLGCLLPGHAHLTDFNIATIIKDGERATALAGTKPYMGELLFLFSNHSCWCHLWCFEKMLEKGFQVLS